MIRAVALVLLAAGAVHAADPCATTVGTVAGVVTGTGGTPLAGATVRVQGCLGAPVVTGADGTFQVAVPAGTQVIAAAADGYYVGCWRNGHVDCDVASAGATGLAIALEALPADDDPAHVFRAPEDCAECHEDVYRDWSASTMAHTNGNLWVDNLYNGTDLRHPRGPADDPNHPQYFSFLKSHNTDATAPTRLGECANCHQPEYVGTSPTNTSFNAFSAPTFHGITCDFCHKVVDVDVSADGIRRPNLVVGAHGLPAKTTMLRSASQPWLAFGPLDDVTFGAVFPPAVPKMRAAHATIVHSSRLCASCHEDHADPRDVRTDDFLETYAGPPSQTTYSEWAASDFAARGVECQDCHMPPTGADHFCSRTSLARDPAQVRSHRFEGTTPEFLRRAVTLRTRTTSAGGVLTVDVDVANSGAGHALPTGVTLRNMVLVVDAHTRDGTALTQLSREDGGGTRVPNWGGVGDPASGNLAGLPGKGYARVLVDENLVENVLFTEAVNAFDNRIPAGQTDASSYRFTLPARRAARDVRVETRLYYRRAFKPLADQRRWNVALNGNAHGTRGDGTDYDENLVVVSTRTSLACRGHVGRLSLAAAADGVLTGDGVLKLPRGATIDPPAGIQVTLGVPNASPAVQDALTDFHVDGSTAEATAVGRVARLRLSNLGRRAVHVTLALRDLDASVLVAHRLDLALDAGDVCFRRALRCKPVHGRLRCR